jgi:hypothetical protein
MLIHYKLNGLNAQLNQLAMDIYGKKKREY